MKRGLKNALGARAFFFEGNSMKDKKITLSISASTHPRLAAHTLHPPHLE